MQTNLEFEEFPKLSRLSREVIVTEKLDGTNAQICITEDGEMLIGSRTRWITPESDNHGFARWAVGHREELLQLGPGRHFGEWWGNGIQRGYGLKNGDKRFSLFNTARWCLSGGSPEMWTREKPQEILPACCGLVPVLWRGSFDSQAIEIVMDHLRTHGSHAAPHFMKPEGVVVFHTAAQVGFKKTIEKDETPKSLQ